MAVGVNKTKLGSQLSITFYTPHAHRRTMDNASESIEYGQYEFEKLANGIKVTYTIGKKKRFILSLRKSPANVLTRLRRKSAPRN